MNQAIGEAMWQVDSVQGIRDGRVPITPATLHVSQAVGQEGSRGGEEAVVLLKL